MVKFHLHQGQQTDNLQIRKDTQGLPISAPTRQKPPRRQQSTESSKAVWQQHHQALAKLCLPRVRSPSGNPPATFPACAGASQNPGDKRPRQRCPGGTQWQEITGAREWPHAEGVFGLCESRKGTCCDHCCVNREVGEAQEACSSEAPSGVTHVNQIMTQNLGHGSLKTKVVSPLGKEPMWQKAKNSGRGNRETE